METEDKIPGASDSQDLTLDNLSNDEKASPKSDDEELDDKQVREYFLQDPNEVEAEQKFKEIENDPELVGDMETFFDSDGEDKEPTPDDGYYREGPGYEFKPPPNYFEPTVKDLEYESEHDDTVDPMEVEESKRVPDPNYINSIDLNYDGQDLDLDKVDFASITPIDKNEPEEFVIQSGYGPESLVEDLRAVPIDIVTREQWGALPRPEGEQPLKLPVLYIHMEYHTPVDPCFSKEDCIKAVKEIQRIHIEERGLPDIAHNFLIGGDGNAYEGRGWHVKAEKSNELPKYSGKYLEFAYIGDYRVKMQTKLIMKTQFSLIKKGLELNYIDEYFTLMLKHLNLTRDWIGK